jgi:hypothetical protein
MRTRVIVLALGLIAGSTAFRAQVVKQGDPDAKLSPTAFHSPMIIETVFAAVDRSLWSQAVQPSGRVETAWFEAPEYNALGKFTCDGIAFHGNFIDRKKETWKSGLAMQARTQPGDQAEVTIRVSLFNPENNHDKSVTLFLEFLNGSDVAASTTMGPLKVEDKGHGYDAQARMTLPISALKTEPPTKLRITMSAKDQ